MVPAQDALITLPHEYYGQYLEQVYLWMAQYVPPNANVMEVGVRPEDRGVISRRIIPHRSFIGVDRRPDRGELVLDVLQAPIRADVIISTCVLHHTPRSSITRLLAHLNAGVLLFSGPNAAVLPELIGDHQWHIEVPILVRWLEQAGYRVTWEPSGLSEPRCEVVVAAVSTMTDKKSSVA